MGGLPVREAPLTNTDEKGEICSGSVEFAQTFTKCLQYWEMVVRKWAFWLGLWALDGGGSFDCGLASPPTGGVGLGYSIACTARRRGVSFAPAKETKTGQRGTELSPLQTPLTLGCAGYEYCFSAVAEKQIRTARRCAPKVACGGIFIARALEREGRTTSPLLPLSLQCRTASLTRSHCSCRSPRNCRCIRHRRRSNSLPLKGGELCRQ